MDQFLSRLLDKYGLARMVVAVAAGFIILWALAHFSAAPGGNVSVLFGLVQYTKSKPDTPTIRPNIAGPEITKLERALSQYEQLSKTSDSAALGTTPTVIHGVTKKNVNQTLQTLRSQRHLRALETLESGRSVAETPRETYFFISIYYLTTTPNGMVKTIGEQKVGRFANNDTYFEIQFLRTGPPIIIGFASESDAIRIDSPSADIGKVSISPVPWEKMTSLVSLFTDRVATAKYRKLDLAEGNDVLVLDCEIQ